MVYPSESIILKAFSSKFSAAAVAVVKRVFAQLMNGNGLAASCWQSSLADGWTDVGGCDLAVCKSYVKVSTKLLAYS